MRLVQRAQVQSAAELGERVGGDCYSLGIDRREARNDVGVLRVEGGDQLAIGARAGLFFIGLEIGQGGFQQ